MQQGFKAVHFLLLLQVCWIFRVTLQCGVPDSQPLCETTPVLKSVVYSLTLSSTEYSSSPSTTYSATSVISVKLGTTTCPSSLADSPGPKWYKLEAVSELTNEPAGTFATPVSRSEAHLCEGRIIFSSCEPFVLDLPRTYTWIPPKENVGNICFKLTIVKDGSDSCEQVSKCISSNIMAFSGNDEAGSGVHGKPLQDKATEDFISEEEEKLVHGSNQRSPRHCYSKWNCTNKKMKDFCASDGHTYPSRCAFRLEECLTGMDMDIIHSGPCLPPTEPTIEPYCENDKSMNQSPWIPKCNCNGRYKPVQCYQNRCWCSNIRGYETINLGHWSCDDSVQKSNFEAKLLRCLPNPRR